MKPETDIRAIPAPSGNVLSPHDDRLSGGWKRVSAADSTMFETESLIVEMGVYMGVMTLAELRELAQYTERVIARRKANEMNKWIDRLIKDYIHSEYANFRRILTEAAAKEKLLSGARLYSYQIGTSIPSAVYSDAAIATPYPNPVVFTADGDPPGPIFTQKEGCDLVLRAIGGGTIATIFRYKLGA